MHYLLKGIALIGILPALATSPVGAEPPEQGPIHVSFTPSQLQGETYIFQITQAGDGQIIAGGEKIAYYETNRWRFVSRLRKPAIRSLLINGDTLWVASLNEIGRLELPLSDTSRYEALPLPEIENAGEIWQLAKSGNTLVATTNEEVWFIEPGAKTVRHTRLPSKSRLMLLSYDGKVVVAQSGLEAV